MKAIAGLCSGLLALVIMISSAQAQRTTTLTDETSNNTSGCASTNSSYVGTTSCQAIFPGAKDDSSAGSDQNAGANTVTFDAAPSNLADFTHDGVDIHNLVYAGFNGKVFATVLMWHFGPPFNYTPKSPGPENAPGFHFSVGYTSDDSNQVAAQLAFFQRLNIDGIVANPPGPLPPGFTDEKPQDANVNDAFIKWKTAADGTSSFLFSVMTDHQTWDGNTLCNSAGAHGNFDPACVEKIMICSLDYMNTATTSSFTCPLDNKSYSGGGIFADSHYWTVSGHPVLSYFMNEAAYFGTRCTSTTPCPVYNDNVPGVTCTSAASCWDGIFGGISHHINNFAVRPFVIYRDSFTKHPTPNDGSFRWFNPSTDQTFNDIGNGPSDSCGYACWLNNANTTNPAVALGVGLPKVDHAQSPFSTEIGDHIIMDAQCGKTWLNYLKEPGNNHGFGTSHQFQALEIATFDDYDEGTEMETGIDNCVSSFTAQLVGQTVSWSIAFTAPGDESTIDHYAIFFSTDGTTGQNLTLLTNVAVNSANNGNYSFNITSSLPSPTVIYVKAVGKTMLTNHTVEAGICNSCGGGTPSTGSVVIGNSSAPFRECPPENDFPWTISISVNNVVDEWTLSCSNGVSTPQALAVAWAAQINADPLGQVVTATASGSTINLVSIATGSNTNYPLAAVDNFTQEGWFTLTASGPTMTGGH